MIDDLLNRLDRTPSRITGAGAYVVRVEASRHFSYGTWAGRTHGFFKLCTGEHTAWNEAMVGGASDPPGGPVVTTLESLEGMSLGDALRQIIAWRDAPPPGGLETVESLVLDLAGRVLETPTIELLGLTGRSPVPGLFCVLERDPAQVEVKARLALEQGLRTHLKVKLFGDTDLDRQIVVAARSVLGDRAYLVGDVNGGYRNPASDEPIDAIVTALRDLHATGLSACEDPARMSVDQWVQLQQQVEPLDLVADEPLRPAWVGLERYQRGMANISNTHPACMGSILEAVRLAKRVQAQGDRLMVGDNSLVGPACSMWTQIAVGLGADWCEAIEKPQESDVYQQCRKHEPVARSDDGRFIINDLRPGFGVEIDEEKLADLTKPAQPAAK